MRPQSNIAKDVAELLRSSQELKRRQFIGSDQIVFIATELPGVYDWGGTLTAPSQTPSQRARGILVTATAQNQNNLIADVVIRISKDSDMDPEYTNKNYLQDLSGGAPLFLEYWTVPLPIADSNKKQWQVFMVGNTGQVAYMKAQVVANDNVDIEVVQNV